MCIRSNIVAHNIGGAMVTYEARPTTHFAHNLFWGNDVDFFSILGTIPESWTDEVLLVDPCFCDSDDNDFSLASDSPALNRKEVIGAHKEPGCPPGCQP